MTRRLTRFSSLFCCQRRAPVGSEGARLYSQTFWCQGRRMGVDTESVKKVARLARLALSPAETEALAKDLAGIIAYAEMLQALELDDVPPTAHAIALTCPTREDVAVRDFDPQSVVSRAPEHEGTAFKVPKIIE